MTPNAREGGTPMIAARNIGLCFLSVLLAVGLFSLAFTGLYGWSPDALDHAFRITMKAALPVACLYLPVVITQRDAEEGRMRVIAGWGIVIGPAYLVLRGLIAGTLLERDEASPFGLVAFLVFAFIVGSLTTILYITALKFVHRGSYDAMDSTYEAITNYLDDKRLEAKDLFIEEYTTDPVKVDPDKLVVNVFVPIK